MSLWVDKYRPNSLSKLDFHKKQAHQLKNIIQQGDFPHLLMFGPPGSGKKTRVICLLRELYGAGAERLRMENTSFTTPSNKKVELMIVSSNYHLEVNPSDVGIYDRVVIQDLLKTVAQTHQLDASGQREFKVVVLTSADRLSKDAQHALRRTMEKYMATCRLILIANSASRVIAPIRSRCLGIRVPAPTAEEIATIVTERLLNAHAKERLLNAHAKEHLLNAHARERLLNAHARERLLNAHARERLLNAHAKERLLNAHAKERLLNAHARAVGKKEGISVPPELANRLAEMSNRNLRLALLSLQAARVQQ
uniref:AAA+ ATPase domain-containing protein n=1 Tax=Timema bartmani TaxID=61472 RepID=A0A7R9EPI0_9NEOP|nr:unnamed protein product [Timema bartmani]